MAVNLRPHAQPNRSVKLGGNCRRVTGTTKTDHVLERVGTCPNEVQTFIGPDEGEVPSFQGTGDVGFRNGPSPIKAKLEHNHPRSSTVLGFTGPAV